MRTHTSIRRLLIVYVLPGALLTLFLLSSFRHLSQHTQNIKAIPIEHDSSGTTGDYVSNSNIRSDHLLTGKAIAPKLGNATAKAELGRAAWKLFHTTFARFPDKPTGEESEALRTYLGLFQRLYPWYVCTICCFVFYSNFVWSETNHWFYDSAVNAPNTLALSSRNSLRRFHPAVPLLHGAATSTTKSTSA
jgi:hypothetical protein